jgi:hypothetical protein
MNIASRLERWQSRRRVAEVRERRLAPAHDGPVERSGVMNA